MNDHIDLPGITEHLKKDFAREQTIEKRSPKSLDIPKALEAHRSRILEYACYGYSAPSIFEDTESLSNAANSACIDPRDVKEFDKKEKEYIIYYSYLKNFFSFTFLKTLSLKSVVALHDALLAVNNAIKTGDLTSSDISEETIRLMNRVLNSNDIEFPKERWARREDRLPGEKAIDFLVRVWGNSIEAERLSRNELFAHDERLYGAINTFYSRKKKSAPNQLLLLPTKVLEWIENTATQSTEKIDAKLEELKIVSPEDAFNRNLPIKEAQRLYAAAKRRTEQLT